MTTDTKFFTNENGFALLDRFKATLKDSKYFDVLVGYFRLSGFHQLYASFEKIEKTRILVGLSVDKDTFDIIQYNQENGLIDFESHKNTKSLYEKNIINEIESISENNAQIEFGIIHFIKLLKEGRLELRAYPSQNIHAKVYINRYNDNINHIQYGSVITGSSNFSESGLIAQREFNVELKDKPDVDFALNKFEKLWEESVDVSKDFIDTIITKTWLCDTVTPYEIFLKCIYEYLEEDINLEEIFEPFLPKGFMELRYQIQASTNAYKILETYNGVFLSDVVGLGKTYITALLLQQIQGRVLIVCPPVLQEYWEESMRDFGVRNFEVESLGKLDHILQKDISKYKYVVVDEAHRFRNENTQAYANLLEICRGRKVILVTATPLNNTVEDIFTQLKLFQIPKSSTIPGVPDLEKFFNKLKKELKDAKPIDKTDPIEKKKYRQAIRKVSDQIRDQILRFVMIRRTRTDVKSFFQDDLQKQKIVFPDLAEPGRMIYQYKGHLEKIFNQTVELLHKFNYTRYSPLLHYNGELSEFQKQQQRNVGGFMKGLLVKRLESSFYAFKMSIERFIESHIKFIDMYDKGIVYISKKVNVYDLLDQDDIETLEKLVDEDLVDKYYSKDFKKEYKHLLELDLTYLQQIRKLWQSIDEDPKLDKLTQDLKYDKLLSKNKIIIFTESKETGDYLYEKLYSDFAGKIMFYSSQGARYENLKTITKNDIGKEIIVENFDPKSNNPQNKIRILITTDVLAEGINLHQSNTLINYDLPWNPTRVLQRAGRVNRLGSKFDSIHIYNFFPTTQSDLHLGLEMNITNKLQMFHYIMGEDAKYLSDGEEIGSQELFSTLNSKDTYTGEEEGENTELKYLTLMRDIRDNNPLLFDRIKKLPKQTRSGMKNKLNNEDQMITFFRLGKLKKFYLYQNKKSEEINFFEAMSLMETVPATERKPKPDNYFEMLNINKTKFRQDTSAESEMPTKTGGRSNSSFIERIINERSFKEYKKFTESDEDFIANIRLMLTSGVLAKKTLQIIKKEVEKLAIAENTIDPMKVLYILQKHIKYTDISNASKQPSFLKREVILSEYLLKE